jgi:hypothetical protein
MVKVTVMGSRFVLIQGDGDLDLKQIIQGAQEWFEQWFESIVPRIPNKVAVDRCIELISFQFSVISVVQLL